MFQKLYILFFTFFVCCFANAQVKQDEKKDDFKIVFPQRTFEYQDFMPKQPEQKKVEQQPVEQPKKSGKTPTLVHLEWADDLVYDQEITGDAQVLVGNVTFSHDGVFLYCDSAFFYQANNSFNAFGNVLINQGDTLFVYGDVLYYDGNTKLARLRGNVLMDNLSATLVTDSLNFDRVKNVGYYFEGGVLQDTLNTLYSETGHYYPSTKDAVFQHNVELVNPDFTMTSNNLRYNVNTKVAFIVGPTDIIYDKETHIYSEDGWYNTDNEQSKLLLNSYVFHNSGKKLVADTIFYDKKLGRGEGFTNVVIDDTIKKIALHGHYGYYIENNEIGVVTDSAMMVEYSSEDTLFLHADTLYTRAETFKIPILVTDTVFIKNEAIVFNDTVSVQKDSINFVQNDTIEEHQAIAQSQNDTILQENSISFSLKTDTVWQDSTYKIVQGYYNVRFWRTNIQGVCDSSYFDTRDSVLHLLKKPIIWSDSRQLTGDTIRIFPENGDVDRVVVINNAFVTEFVENQYFNQISGKEIVGFVVENKLKKVDVKGNAESVFYPQDDEDKSIIGQVTTMSSIMNIYFKDEKEIDRINMSPKPSGSMFPLKDVTDDMLFMKNYSWQISKKPVSQHDIFRRTNVAVRDGLNTENQDVDVQQKKKTTRRDDVKPIEEESVAQKKQNAQSQSPTRSTDTNRPSGFATPSFGGGSALGGKGGGGLQRKQF